jgi:hypothetical protein
MKKYKHLLKERTTTTYNDIDSAKGAIVEIIDYMFSKNAFKAPNLVAEAISEAIQVDEDADRVRTIIINKLKQSF